MLWLQVRGLDAAPEFMQVARLAGPALPPRSASGLRSIILAWKPSWLQTEASEEEEQLLPLEQLHSR